MNWVRDQCLTRLGNRTCLSETGKTGYDSKTWTWVFTTGGTGTHPTNNQGQTGLLARKNSSSNPQHIGSRRKNN